MNKIIALFFLGIILLLGCASTQEMQEPIAITERPVIEGKMPVLYVFHDNDNDWIFLASEKSGGSKVFTLPLKEILLLDKSLNEISDLPKNWKAWRKDINQPWQRIDRAYLKNK